MENFQNNDIRLLSDAINTKVVNAILGFNDQTVSYASSWSGPLNLTNSPLNIETGNTILFVGGNFYNPNNVPIFVKLYQTNPAATTIGTTAVNYSFMVPALGQVIFDGTTGIFPFYGFITAAAVTGYDDAAITAPPIPLRCIFKSIFVIA